MRSLKRIGLVMLVMSLISNQAFAIQRELLGISLGAPVESVYASLQQQYGEPYIQGSQTDWKYAAFLVNRASEQLVVIYWGTEGGLEDKVTSVEVKGLTPIGTEDACGLKLGEASDNILEVFPSARAADAGDGYMQYRTDDNVSLETKGGKVVSLKILLDNQIGFVVTRTNGDAVYIGVTELTLPANYESVTEDMFNDAVDRILQEPLPAISGSCASRRDVYLRFLSE